jgi:hypothetical protein
LNARACPFNIPRLRCRYSSFFPLLEPAVVVAMAIGWNGEKRDESVAAAFEPRSETCSCVKE